MPAECSKMKLKVAAESKPRAPSFDDHFSFDCAVGATRTGYEKAAGKAIVRMS